MWQPATAIETEARARDAVQTGGESDGMIIEWLLPVVEGRLAQFAIRLGHQRTAT